MKRTTLIFIAVLAAAVLLTLGYLAGHRPGSAPSQAATAGPASTGSAAHGSGKKVLYWYDTMAPQQHFDHPGLSPMGMQMVPKYAGENPTRGKGMVSISPATVQKLGVRTATVERRVLAAAVQERARSPGTCARPPRSVRASMR